MKSIPLTQGKFVQVDDEDYVLLSLYKWYAIKSGYTYYAVRQFKKKRVWIYKEIMKPSEGLTTDHKDNNGLNCQRYNLRNCTYSQNAQNQKGDRTDYGVSYETTRKKFVSQIKVNGKHINLGCFVNKIDAAKAYNIAALKYFGDNAKLNII